MSGSHKVKPRNIKVAEMAASNDTPNSRSMAMLTASNEPRPIGTGPRMTAI